MSVVPPFMLRLLSASVCAANRAGHIIRDVLKSGQLGIVQKGVNDPQTEADRRAQRCIVATLQQRFPNINIIGEEDISIQEEDYTLVKPDEEYEEVITENCPVEYQNIDEKDVIVWVDPLDGTKEFTEGYKLSPPRWMSIKSPNPVGFPEHVTVLIGISIGGKAISGVIHQPFYGPVGRSVWGMLGLGVKGTTCIPAGDTNGKLKDGLKLVVTRSHMTRLVQDTVDSLKPAENIRVGGSGNKILMVLEGSADVYLFPSLGTKKWDTCAGEALVHAMGGKLTDILGHPLLYCGQVDNIMNAKGLLVTMHGHDDLVARIPQHVKDAFS